MHILLGSPCVAWSTTNGAWLPFGHFEAAHESTQFAPGTEMLNVQSQRLRPHFWVHRCPFWLFWLNNRWRFLVYLVVYHLPGPSICPKITPMFACLMLGRQLRHCAFWPAPWNCGRRVHTVKQPFGSKKLNPGTLVQATSRFKELLFGVPIV